MRKLNSVENINQNNVVLLRMDTDLPMEDGQILDNSRLQKSIPTIKLLLERKNKIVIIGHLGRPKENEKTLSLKPVYLELIQLLEVSCGGDCVKNVFVNDIENEETLNKAIFENEIIFIENLRFWNKEEKGDTSLFDSLKKYCSFFINDAFAVAHRKAASVLLAKEMNSYYGISFINEYEKIGSILENKTKPLVIVLGGAKEDKLKYIEELSKIADYVLVGGKLPVIKEKSYINDPKVIYATLREDQLDLSETDIEIFREVLVKAKTIVWAGAMGYYENSNSQKGTIEIAKIIANSDAYKIIAGGDTSASVSQLGLKNKIDFVCSGGGVMLEMLTSENLPAWD
jgi:phosphoglycerate kinase